MPASPPWRLSVTLAKAALCAVLAWYLIQEPAPAVSKALFYAFFAWACAAAILILTYLLVSMDDIRDVLSASLRTSAAAMWLVPALLLLTMRVPAATAAGLLLIANTMRLLFSRRAPQERPLRAPRRPAPTVDTLFRHTVPPPAFLRETLPVLLGAIALQIAVCLAWTGYPLPSAILVAAGAAILTWVSVGRGAYWRNKPPSARFSLLSVVLTLLLAALLSVGQVAEDSESANIAGFMATTARIGQELAHAPDSKHPSPKRSLALLSAPKVKKFTPAANQVPGVILRPPAHAQQKAVALQPMGQHLALAGMVTFPFTGEYHLFPSSSGGVQRDSVVHRGTPLDFLYASASGGPVETEAYQRLDPPFDFSACGKILLKLTSGETTPASALLQLDVAGKTVEIGTGIFALEPASEETLEFEMPPPVQDLTAHAIRVIFHRNPAESDRTTKVAIQQFALIPRHI